MGKWHWAANYSARWTRMAWSVWHQPSLAVNKRAANVSMQKKNVAQDSVEEVKVIEVELWITSEDFIRYVFAFVRTHAPHDISLSNNPKSPSQVLLEERTTNDRSAPTRQHSYCRCGFDFWLRIVSVFYSAQAAHFRRYLPPTHVGFHYVRLTFAYKMTSNLRK